jgi:U3 small nucleolar RNA-associated protein 5
LKKKQGRVVDSMVVEKKIVEEPSIEDQLKEQIVLTNQTEKKMTMTTLTAMLTQALISSDVEMLEKALWTSDKKVIYATIQRLNVVHVIPLLDELVIRIQKRPTRTHLLVEWLRGCLLIHQGYLVSVPHLTYKLGSLYKSLVNRVDVLNKLSRLNGRLDIITMNVIGEDVDEFVFEDGESQDSDAFDDEEDQLE